LFDPILKGLQETGKDLTNANYISKIYKDYFVGVKEKKNFQI